MTSSTGSRLSAWSGGSQVGNARMSWPDLRLRFGGDGHQVLVALRGDVVDLDFDLLLRGPFLDSALVAPCWRPAPSGPRSRSRACRRRWPCARTVRQSSLPTLRPSWPRTCGESFLAFRHVLPCLVLTNDSMVCLFDFLLSMSCLAAHGAGGQSAFSLAGGCLAEVAREALVRTLQMLAHRARARLPGRSRRSRRGSRRAPRARRCQVVVFQVWRASCSKYGLMRRSKSSPTKRTSTRVVERLGYGVMEAAVEAIGIPER